MWPNTAVHSWDERTVLDPSKDIVPGRQREWLGWRDMGEDRGDEDGIGRRAEGSGGETWIIVDARSQVSGTELPLRIRPPGRSILV